MIFKIAGKHFVVFVQKIHKKNQSGYNLRPNTSYILAIMTKYRQAAKETKPLIFMINSEKRKKKDRKKVTMIYVRNH